MGQLTKKEIRQIVLEEWLNGSTIPAIARHIWDIWELTAGTLKGAPSEDDIADLIDEEEWAIDRETSDLSAWYSAKHFL